VITKRVRARTKFNRSSVIVVVAAVVVAGAVLFLARMHGWWAVAMLVVAVAELGPLRATGVPKGGWRNVLLERANSLIVGLSVVLVIALVPRLATQVAVAGLYVGWLSWPGWGRPEDRAGNMLQLLVVQGVATEAVFLMEAIWRPGPMLGIVPVSLVLVWAASYVSVYATLARRGERSAGIMAATWSLVAVEVSWVLMLWLFTYTTAGGYLLVPQPALVLTALAYCFGSIYVAQREGKLSRGRLTEYLLIGLILIAIVAIGTSWRGSI
jgi:hypothetical protein